MKKIISESLHAFYHGKDFKKSNMQVEINEGGASMYQHGNLIAVKHANTGRIDISNAGWTSSTSKERLNAIITSAPGARFQRLFQKDFEWFIERKNGEIIPFPSDQFFTIN